MSQETRNENAPATSNPVNQPRRRLRLWLGAVSLVGAGAIIGALGTVGAGAYAGGAMSRMMHGEHNPAEGAERINYKVGWVMDRIDATDEQKAEVAGIVEGAAQSLIPQFVDHRGHKAELMAALTGDVVDRAQLEALRQSHLDLAESVSAELVDVAVDIANVLTPEQRVELAEYIKAHRARHHGHGHRIKYSPQAEDNQSHRL